MGLRFFDRREKEVNRMTPNGTATTWEPMELRYVGDVEEVMQGGINDSQGPANGKSLPSPDDPGEPNLKTHGQEPH
jgi:hypothetical protein